jgi:hypothetical protein
LEAFVSRKLRKLEFKMSSVYKLKNDIVYRRKVGERPNEKGEAVRDEFRLGSDPIKAHQ